MKGVGSKLNPFQLGVGDFDARCVGRADVGRHDAAALGIAKRQVSATSRERSRYCFGIEWIQALTTATPPSVSGTLVAIGGIGYWSRLVMRR